MALIQEKNGLKLPGKLSAREAAEARRDSQSRLTYVRSLIRWAYALIFAGLLLWMTLDMAVKAPHVDWSGFVSLWLIVVAVFAWLAFRGRSFAARTLVRLNASAPDYYILTAQGIQAESDDGAKSSIPWSAYAGWREGNRVMFMLFPEKERVQLLPKRDLSPSTLDTLRGILISALGQRKRNDLRKTRLQRADYTDKSARARHPGPSLFPMLGSPGRKGQHIQQHDTDNGERHQQAEERAESRLLPYLPERHNEAREHNEKNDKQMFRRKEVVEHHTGPFTIRESPQL